MVFGLIQSTPTHLCSYLIPCKSLGARQKHETPGPSRVRQSECLPMELHFRLGLTEILIGGYDKHMRITPCQDDSHHDDYSQLLESLELIRVTYIM